MPTVDAVELVIRMTKGEGVMPDFSGLKPAVIKKLIKLSVDVETLKDFGFTHYRIIKGGEKSETIKIQEGGIGGYPTLKVRIYAYPDMKQVNVNVFGDDRVRVGECFSYKVERNDEPFFFIDANGYTEPARITAEMKPPEVFDEKVRPKAIAL